MTGTADTPQGSAARRPPLDHPVRKALYALRDIRSGVATAEVAVEGLIQELRVKDTDPVTWDELVQLRRDLRVAASQIDHFARASSEWSYRSGMEAAGVHDE